MHPLPPGGGSTDARRDTYSDTCPDSYCNADASPYAYTHADACAGRDSAANSDSNGHTHPGAYRDADSYAGGHTHARPFRPASHTTYVGWTGQLLDVPHQSQDGGLASC